MGSGPCEVVEEGGRQVKCAVRAVSGALRQAKVSAMLFLQQQYAYLVNDLSGVGLSVVVQGDLLPALLAIAVLLFQISLTY